MTLDLTFAGGDYDLTAPLMNGRVEPQGVDLTSVTYSSATRHWRMMQHQEFDVCELSLAYYLASRADPETYAFTAIPVFPHRLFRHSYIFTHAGSDVDDPGDFAGGAVGLKNWQATSGVWMRGIAQEAYGLDLSEVTWYVDLEEDVPLSTSERYDIRETPPGTNVEEMLLAGDLDGAMYPVIMDSVRDPEANAERVFPDYPAVEREYYERTGIFPPMHTVVIRDRVLEEHPWVAVNVYEAFEEARSRSLERLADPRSTGFVWPNHYYEAEREVFGESPWQYGLTPDNRTALTTLQQYAREQEIVPHAYDLEDLFVESTLDSEIQDRGYTSGSHGDTAAE